MESSSVAGSPSAKDIPFDPVMLRPAVQTILRGADRSSVSAKGVRKELQGLYPFIDIKQHKAECDALIIEVFESMPAPEADDEEEDDEEEEEIVKKPKKTVKRDSSSPPPKPKVKKSAVRSGHPTDEEVAYRLSLELNGPVKATRGGGAGQPKSWGRKEKKTKSRATVDSEDDSAASDSSSKPKKKKKRAGPKSTTGYNKLLQLSPQLAAVTGYDVLSRPAVVKQLWKHIKRNSLQNPQDRREIRCDHLMRQVMPATVTMFSMNKYLGAHLSPYEGDAEPPELSD